MRLLNMVEMLGDQLHVSPQPGGDVRRPAPC